MIDNGVYIGSDFEMIVTDTYIITFRRNTSSGILESRLLKSIGQKFSCIGICQSSPIETEQNKPPLCWRTAFIFDGEIVAACEMIQGKPVIENDYLPVYKKEVDEQMKSYIGSSLVMIEDNEKILVQFEDGVEYSAIMDEVLNTNSLQPMLPDITNENIGECLRLWNMGIQEEFFDIGGKSAFIGVAINTNKHMYIFEKTPDSIYCRAARFTTTNKGVVFNQNFRQGVEAYMIRDNTEARLPLVIDEAYFSNDSCIWNNRSVYWSLVSYTDSEIRLHGCQGDIYHWKKPKRKIE